MKIYKFMIVVLLSLIFFQLYIIDMGVKVMNSNLVEICQILNPNDEVTIIKTLDDYHKWLDEEADK